MKSLTVKIKENLAALKAIKDYYAATYMGQERAITDGTLAFVAAPAQEEDTAFLPHRRKIG